MDQISNQKDYEQFLIKNYKLCAHHKQRLTILQIDNYQNGHLLICLDFLKAQTFKFVPLIEFLINDRIIKEWPVLEDSQIYDQLKDIKQQNELYDFISNFYKQLKEQICSLLEIKKKNTIKNLNTIYDSFENPLDLYNKFSQKEKLRHIILNSYQDQNKQNDEFSNILQDNLKNQGSYKSKILESLNNYNALNFEQLYKIKDQMIKTINQINDLEQIKINLLKDLNQIMDNQLLKQIQNIKQIAQALERNKSMTKLTLNLSDNQINYEEAKQIALALENQRILLISLLILMKMTLKQME
ncbi:hypothetical protein ABPG72_012437 [Tetrahymena utriculariae]